MLLDPCELPGIGTIRNRIVMAPMTRSFAPGHIANERMADYYARRAEAGAGLIVTEGTVIHPSGDGYRDVPYIETLAHANAWRPIVARVQAAGGRLLCQLWHCGRISHADFTGGVPPVSSTDKPAEGMNRQNNKPFGTPRALSPEDMPAVYAQFANAARQALAAGFDGVELHFANGYLADQFMDARVNERTDGYGGSVANRCRFPLDCLQAVIDAVGAARVAVRLSPVRDMGGIYEWPDLDTMIGHLVPAMAERGLTKLAVTNARADYWQTGARVVRKVRPLWPHFLMAGASLRQEEAEREIAEGWIDAAMWGRFFIANPDLARVFAAGATPKDFEPAMLAELR